MKLRVRQSETIHYWYFVLQEGTAIVLAASESTEAGVSDLEAAVALMHDPRVTRAWCGLQFVTQALRTGDGTVGPFLAPHLLAFLPSLLKLQVRCMQATFIIPMANLAMWDT